MLVFKYTENSSMVCGGGLNIFARTCIAGFFSAIQEYPYPQNINIAPPPPISNGPSLTATTELNFTMHINQCTI